ncbi:YjiH family protein [Thalassotalea nanhaiensis]|uniref:YjiH family protein n=1 Tax=Thalassotalea nanhaiensis TaxID=3065648 RepID=A0ABY9TJW4_9GAMM|nr:YjiH family protein [Colwelliaceae bacterium SQ345]
MKEIITTRNKLMFILPSLLGLGLFLFPLEYDGKTSIPVAVLAKILENAMSDFASEAVCLLILISAILSLIVSIFRPKSIHPDSLVGSLFIVTPIWLVIRSLGAAFAIIVYTKVGPEIVWNGNTGGLLLNDLMPILFAMFIFAGLLLPLLLNFGLLEFIGTLFSKVMRPLFNLPGRSAIDCTTSWLGDGTVGVLLTNKQYEQKIYTQKEAAVVGTTFSAVSITFSLIVIAEVGLAHMFIPFYFAVCLAGFVAALIVPRLPPLVFKKDLYIDGTLPDPDAHKIPEGDNVFSHGFKSALMRAAQIKSFSSVIADGIQNALEMLFIVIPVVMGIGTIALICAEYTPIFDYLGMPFVPYLELLQVPEAATAAKSVVIGFADMFLPAILIAGVESEFTRFVVAALSITQLVYLSEVGAMLLGTKIPVNILDLFVIFILRTVVTLPVIVAVAHFVYP